MDSKQQSPVSDDDAATAKARDEELSSVTQSGFTSKATASMTKWRAVAVLTMFCAPVVVAQTAANWTQQIQQNFPPPRFVHAQAYDLAHGQVILFAGGNNINVFNDTWAWDGSNWTEKSPGTGPPARYSHAMAYDSAHGQVVLFGGASPNSNLLNDTWVWDGSNWTQKSPQTSPPARYGLAMAYDSTHGQVVLFGGANPPSGTSLRAAGEAYPETLGDTWVWDGSNWTQKSPQTSPPARAAHGMADDSAHRQVVLFGGEANGNFLGDTWVWDGSNWTQKAPQTSPSARYLYAMANESAHGQVLLFGGIGIVGAKSNVLNDTWVWDGSNWTQESPQNSPTARTGTAMAYDSVHDQTVLFGGFVGMTALGETWTWSRGPAPAVSAVVNGASFVGGGVVPGAIATAFGTNLTSGPGINLTSSLPLPTMFLNDAVIINNQPVALFAVDNVSGQQQINFQVPWEAASGPNATVAVENNGTTGASISVPVLAAQPGIFNYSAGGNTFGAILHANFQLADTGHPARAGETVLIYCTGLGAVSSPPEDGAPGNGQPTKTTPTVTIGAASAMVSFSGLAPGFVGLYQINAEVPAGLTAGNQPVVVMLAGASSNSVLLPLQ